MTVLPVPSSVKPSAFANLFIAHCERLAAAGVFDAPVVSIDDKGYHIDLHPVRQDDVVIGHATRIDITDRIVTFSLFGETLDVRRGRLVPSTVPYQAFSVKEIGPIKNALASRALELHPAWNALDCQNDNLDINRAVTLASARFMAEAAVLRPDVIALPAAATTLFGRAVNDGTRDGNRLKLSQLNEVEWKRQTAARLTDIARTYQPLLEFFKFALSTLHYPELGARWLPDSAVTMNPDRVYIQLPSFRVGEDVYPRSHYNEDGTKNHDYHLADTRDYSLPVVFQESRMFISEALLAYSSQPSGGRRLNVDPKKGYFKLDRYGDDNFFVPYSQAGLHHLLESIVYRTRVNAPEHFDAIQAKAKETFEMVAPHLPTKEPNVIRRLFKRLTL